MRQYEIKLLPYNRYRGRVGRAPLRSARALDPRRITGLETFGVDFNDPTLKRYWRDRPFGWLPKWAQPRPRRRLTDPWEREEQKRDPWEEGERRRRLVSPPSGPGRRTRAPSGLVSPGPNEMPPAVRAGLKAAVLGPFGWVPEVKRLVSPPPGVRGVGASPASEMFGGEGYRGYPSEDAYNRAQADAARQLAEREADAAAREAAEASRIDPIFGTVFDSLIREAGQTARQMLGRGEISEEDYRRAERLAEIVRRGQPSAFGSPLVVLGVVAGVGLVVYLATRRRR